MTTAVLLCAGLDPGCAGQEQQPETQGEPRPQVRAPPLLWTHVLASPLRSSPFHAPREGWSRTRPLMPLPRPRSNVAKVNIFYQELNYRTMDETPMYSVSQPGPRARGARGTQVGGPLLRSWPADACRCLSCSRPWAASGACGSARPSSLSWSCWNCCSMPWPLPCCWATAGSTGLGGPSGGRSAD